MKVQSMLAAAILALEGVSAHPFSHSALHKLRLRDILAKKDQASDAALKGHNWCQDFPGGIGCDGVKQVGAFYAAPSAPASAGNAPASTGSSQSAGGGSGSCLDLTKLFSKRATTQQDSYMGNSDNNIHPEANCQSSKPYSLTFVNKMGSKKTFWLWNKAGPDGKPNGMMYDASKIFDLEDGQKATFSFDANSLVGFSQACGRATANGNVPNCNVGEASFADGNTWGGSNGGSFYDVSMVPVTMIGKSATSIPMSISAPGQSTSSNTECNYVQAADNSPQNPPAGGACNCGTQSASQEFHPTVTFG